MVSPILILGQNPPNFQSNEMKDKKVESIILNNMKGANEFEFMLAFHQVGYWNTGIKYTVLGYYQGNWTAFNWTIYYKSNKRTAENIRKTKRRKTIIKPNQLDRLFVTLDSNDFWNLNIDSLNVYTKTDTIINDSLSALGIDAIEYFFNISDGDTWVFEVINNTEYRHLSSYEPEYFQEVIPIEERLKFMDCKKTFLSIFSGK